MSTNGTTVKIPSQIITVGIAATVWAKIQSFFVYVVQFPIQLSCATLQVLQYLCSRIWGLESDRHQNEPAVTVSTQKVQNMLVMIQAIQFWLQKLASTLPVAFPTRCLQGRSLVLKAQAVVNRVDHKLMTEPAMTRLEQQTLDILNTNLSDQGNTPHDCVMGTRFWTVTLSLQVGYVRMLRHKRRSKENMYTVYMHVYIKYIYSQKKARARAHASPWSNASSRKQITWPWSIFWICSNVEA